MIDLARLAPVLLATALLAACSGGGSSPEPQDGGRVMHDGAKDDASRPDAHEGGRVEAALPDVFVPGRAPGDRTPLSGSCDPVDGVRCLLPWPSNTFTVKSATSATGLELAISATGIGATDDPSSVNRADGFSRVSPILTGFAGTLDATTFGDLTTGGVRLIVEQPGPTFGQQVPLRFATVTNGDATNPQSVIIAYPRVPLAPATDYAVVVTGSILLSTGKPLTADRNAQVALGLAAPRTAYEGELYAYDAPARSAMKAAGLDPTHAVRVWDFTTRSLAGPTMDLDAMRALEIAAFDATFAPDGGSPGDAGVVSDSGAGGGVGITIDSVSTTAGGAVAVAVLGRITGVPSFLTAAGALERSAAGAPSPMGAHDVPFRAAIPAGTGDYHIVMYGHGTGGSYDETSFDQEITGGGAVKVGTQFIGWTGASIGATFGLFTAVMAGSDISAAGLTQSLADTMVVQHALGSRLGALLAAPTLAGTTNPAAGRRPSMTQPVWAGGSLGGTMGFVYSAAEPSIEAAVLNVPGAAWTHFVTGSTLFDIVKVVMRAHYPTDIDIWLAIATSQLNFDAIDGAAWYDAVGSHHPVLLEQESIGDPVLPNIGNEMVAAASHAQQVGVVLRPIVTCQNVSQAVGQTGMTQFKVPASVTAPLQIHGFAAGSSPAGIAAQQQIQAFIGSVWGSSSPLIAIPPACVSNTPANSCDFSSQ